MNTPLEEEGSCFYNRKKYEPINFIEGGEAAAVFVLPSNYVQVCLVVLKYGRIFKQNLLARLVVGQ